MAQVSRQALARAHVHAPRLHPAHGRASGSVYPVWMRPFLLTALLLTSMLTVSRAGADDLTCSGALTGRTVEGDVTVRAGSTCTLSNVRVDGNVKVGRGATVVLNRVRVDGNVETDSGFRAVTVVASVVDGNIQAERGANVRIENTRVNGNIELERNSGTLRVARATVDGNLKCEANTRTPTGGSNRVKGEREGQCRSL